MARRAALATQGKKGVAAMRAAATLAGVGLLRNETLGQAVALGLTGRQIAMARRAEQSVRGRSKVGNVRPAAHLRPAVAKGEAVPKVERSETLKGKTVTGTSVERRQRVTGNEVGSTRTITGTEYVGASQYELFGKGRPAPGPDKVGSTQTARGRTVTGTELGHVQKVTGDESGACKRVTGTEYLAADRFAAACGGAPQPGAEKVAVFSTGRGKPVTGTPVERSEKITGNEAGAGRPITGSSYVNEKSQQSAGGKTPVKVEVTHTVRNQAISGTAVGRGARVTGDEAGSCHVVSGTEYISNEQFQSFCRATPYQPPAKVGGSTTWGGQGVTGSQVGRSTAVTGDEAGGERPISGSQYFPVSRNGRMETVGHPRKPDAGPAAIAHDARVTGSQVGRSERVTGDETGACQSITGSAYASPEQYRAFCDSLPASPAREARETPLALHPRFGPDRQAQVAPAPADAPPAAGRADFSAFSVVSPARAARQRITGTVSAGGSRITGPVNLADSLVSGTPEFRYLADMTDVALPTASSAEAVAAGEPAAPARERITGEGRQEGRSITGDAWQRGGRITGTEGSSAMSRNPTLRGAARTAQSGAGAQANRAIERPEAPSTKITGSAGATIKGPLVTVSGGARG